MILRALLQTLWTEPSERFYILVLHTDWPEEIFIDGVLTVFARNQEQRCRNRRRLQDPIPRAMFTRLLIIQRLRCRRDVQYMVDSSGPKTGDSASLSPDPPILAGPSRLRRRQVKKSNKARHLLHCHQHNRQHEH